MGSLYFKVKEKDVAKAKGLKYDRALRATLNKPDNPYIYRRVKVRGGYTYEILLESLEPHIQKISIKEMHSASTQPCMAHKFANK